MLLNCYVIESWKVFYDTRLLSSVYRLDNEDKMFKSLTHGHSQSVSDGFHT
jgi:hypothetical protein